MKKEILKIVLINSIIFFFLIFLHEFSHIGIASLIGCKTKGLYFDLNNNYAYAKILCPSEKDGLIYSSGLLGSIFTASIFLFIKSYKRNFFFLISGFSLIQSSLDISILLKPFYSYLFSFIGLILILLGEYGIALSFAKIKSIYFENGNLI